jgi:hypothetical protein
MTKISGPESDFRSGVADPGHFGTDPDRRIRLIRIWIQLRILLFSSRRKLKIFFFLSLSFIAYYVLFEAIFILT